MARKSVGKTPKNPSKPLSTGSDSKADAFGAAHPWFVTSPRITSTTLSTGSDSKAGAFGAAHPWFVTSPRIELLSVSALFIRGSHFLSF